MLSLFQLFFSDPSGMFVRYKCKAIGSGSEGAQSTLQEGYSDSLTLAEAEALAVSTLKQVTFALIFLVLLFVLAFCSSREVSLFLLLFLPLFGAAQRKMSPELRLEKRQPLLFCRALVVFPFKRFKATIDVSI